MVQCHSSAYSYPRTVFTGEHFSFIIINISVKHSLACFERMCWSVTASTTSQSILYGDPPKDVSQSLVPGNSLSYRSSELAIEQDTFFGSWQGSDSHMLPTSSTTAAQGGRLWTALTDVLSFPCLSSPDFLVCFHSVAWRVSLEPPQIIFWNLMR